MTLALIFAVRRPRVLLMAGVIGVIETAISAKILGFGLCSDGSQIWKGMVTVYLSVIAFHKVGLPT